MNGKEILSTLLGEISSGLYSDSARLPSEAALCTRFGVSRMTVRGALDELRRRGLIEKRNGSGSFLTRQALRRSHLIGLIIPDYADYEFFSRIKADVERHARRLGYQVVLVTTTEREPEAIRRDLRRKTRELAVARAEGAIFRPCVSETFSAASREVVSILHHAKSPLF